MTSLLILSFSELQRDPRVQRQIALFAPRYEVTTVGFGPAPHEGVRHIQLPEGTRAWPSSKPHLLTKRYRQAYWAQSAIVAAYSLLQMERHAHDAVLANDVNALPIALWLDPRRGVHADLHEYAPREKEHVRTWRWFIAPYQRWLCRTCLPRMRSISTVSPGLAREYERCFGVDVFVVTNAAAFEDRAVRPTVSPIKLLHTGVARANRHLEHMIEAMKGAGDHVRLDLMLVPSEPGYIEELAAMASGLDAVELRDPVPYTHLVETVAEYDVSIVVFPDSTFNLTHSLPNKLFEAVQARSAVIVGPSPDMAEVVQEYGIGQVLPSADTESMRTAFRNLTLDDVDRWKVATGAHARALSAEKQVLGWERALAAILT